jgi:hypothetical protein
MGPPAVPGDYSGEFRSGAAKIITLALLAITYKKNIAFERKAAIIQFHMPPKVFINKIMK